MSYKTGADTVIVHGVGGTFGTADTISAGDKLIVDSLSANKNPEELQETGIGSGAVMASDAQQGATTPTINVTGTGYFNDAKLQALAVFFQGESVTGNSSGYSHSFMHSTFNQKYLTTAWQYAANSVAEAASCAVTRFQRTFDNPPNYTKTSYDLLANDIKYTGTTNSYATIDAATVASTKKIIIRPTDIVVLNGATVSVTSVDLNLTKEQTSPREIKNSAGNGAPIPSGDPPFQGTVTVTLKSLDDHTYFSGALADSTYTLTITTTGDAISGSANYTEKWYFPALKLIQEPTYDLSSGGVNPLTLTFKCIYASSIPSGHFSLYPHCMVINDRSTTYLS